MNEAHKDHWYWEGDARRCPVHSNVKTSSPCGMFDAPCGQCESEMYENEQESLWGAVVSKEEPAIAEERENKKEYLDNDIPF